MARKLGYVSPMSQRVYYDLSMVKRSRVDSVVGTGNDQIRIILSRSYLIIMRYYIDVDMGGRHVV